MGYESLDYFKDTGYTRQFEVGLLTMVSQHINNTWDSEYHIELTL